MIVADRRLIISLFEMYLGGPAYNTAAEIEILV